MPHTAPVPGTLAPQPTNPDYVLTPRFKWVFSTIVGFTILILIAYIALCVIFPHEDPTSRIQGLIETLKSTFMIGFGAIVGLLGGKAL